MDAHDLKAITDWVAGFRANLMVLCDPETSEAVVRNEYIEQIPIKIPATTQEQGLADQIAERVPLIIEAKRQLQESRGGDRAQERLEREIESHQQRIDALVCQLYGVDEVPG